MRRGRWADESSRLLAAADHGVITVRALHVLGVPEATTYRRCLPGGPWIRLAPGVVALQSGLPSRQQFEIAALLHAGPGSMLTGMSAGRLHGLRRGPDPVDVHVLVHHSRQVRSHGLIVVERTRRLPTPQWRGGMPVAPVARAVCDEARRWRDPATIAALFAEAVQQRRVLPEMLRRELDAGTRKGTATPRRVLGSVQAGVRSAAEYAGRNWWLAQPELPRARWNVRVRDEEGRLVGVVDALVEDVGFAWEIDSVEEHFATPEQVADTAVRRRALRTVGLYVVSTRPTQWRDDPAGVLRDLQDGLAMAALLPPPRVSYADDLAPRTA